ncbi:MAG: CehA/McbA family metallohydrolase [Pirellulaceae bacterium]|nr:CehA/McbA family metallohydrolase [Pirellulaceae bacterium]
MSVSRTTTSPGSATALVLVVVVSAALVWSCVAPVAAAAEGAVLTAANYRQWAPRGKEVDAIVGDYVLRNDRIVVVIARPLPRRDANMTVRNVGGGIIDLTRRREQSDQLSVFYPGSANFPFHDASQVSLLADGKRQGVSSWRGKAVSWQCTSAGTANRPTLHIRYSLADGDDAVVVESTFENTSQKVLQVALTDAIRADRTFSFGGDVGTNLVWAYDEWFRQAYGIVAESRSIVQVSGRATTLQYQRDGAHEVALPAGGSLTLRRKVFPAADSLTVRGIARQIKGQPTRPVAVQVVDGAGPVKNAKVTLTTGDEVYGSGRTDADGRVRFRAPPGEFTVKAEAIGRPAKQQPLADDLVVELAQCGYVVAEITDQTGAAIPCKVAFHAIDGESPDYGPDSLAHATANLQYSANGVFRCEIGPGRYEAVVSRGPEYDAVTKTIEVTRGKQTMLRAELERVVDTRGWVSVDYHSHSSPSGDNTGDQLGRVLNLLAEHVEFAPCTEHNRIDSYDGHISRLRAGHLLATCAGIELTGNPLPVNHQNAFPLIHRPWTQDGGGPTIDLNPVAQIERLAIWDNRAEKLVQLNHPNLVQMLGDRDLDGKADAGYQKMFGFVDIMELHPADGILTPPTKDEKGLWTRNPIFHWMQMLNRGYRIPGAINSDAHYNLHGSCWARNYVRSSTDDPAKIDTMEMVRQSKRGRLVMTNGPYLEFSVASRGGESAGPGDDLKSNGAVTARIEVQCSNWIDINRVQIFVNGRPRKEYNYTRRSTPQRFSDKVTKFAETIEIDLKRDAHLIAVAAGEGIQLGRVNGPLWGAKMPIAVSNPVFVDVDGDGFEPNGDMLDVPIAISIPNR